MINVENQIHLGILGSGMIVKDLFRFIYEIKEYQIEGICARNKEKLELLAKENKIPRIYIDYDEMLENKDIDTIYVAVPNHLHYSMCKKALEKGKNVICEKPFTSNSKELKKLMALAKKKQLILVEAITNQYLENYLDIKKNLDKLGRIKIVECNFSQYSSRYNAFKQGEILPAFDVNKSGGALMDLNVYNIHFVVGLFGKPMQVQYLANIEKGIDTSGILMMDYGTFKCVCIGAKDCKAPLSSNIQGDLGCIHLDKQVSVCSSYDLILNDGSKTTINLNQANHRMYNEFKQFSLMLLKKDYEYVSKQLNHNLMVMEVIDQAKASANLVFKADQDVL